MKCLVTGAAGFVGSSLSDRLLELGHTVVGVDCFVDYYSRTIKERNLSNALSHNAFSFQQKNLVEADIGSLLNGVDWVFHQAGQAGVRASWGNYFESYIAHNIFATQRLLEAARKIDSIKKIVFASSSSIYGNAETLPTRETAVPQPVSPYGVTKLAAEHLVTLYASQFHLPTVSLRYFTVFGPRQRPDMGFHRFIKAALKKEEITIYGDGEQSRDFTFILDIVEANISAANFGDKGQVFNIGGGTQSTINEVLSIIQGYTGPIKVKREAAQVGDARHTSADCSAAKAVLRYSPKVSLSEGIKREVEWVEKELCAGTL